MVRNTCPIRIDTVVIHGSVISHYEAGDDVLYFRSPEYSPLMNNIFLSLQYYKCDHCSDVHDCTYSLISRLLTNRKSRKLSLDARLPSPVYILEVYG